MHAARCDAVMGVVTGLSAINRAIAVVLGVALLATAALILVEITMRGHSAGMLGGTDEVSGYVMAGVGAWGFAFALLERAHVRIDLLHRRLPGLGRAALDLLSLASLAVVSALVSYQGWRVLATTLERDSRANTPLETPLWIPQTVWFAGWVWFTLSALVLLVATAALVAKGRLREADAAAGVGNEAEAET